MPSLQQIPDFTNKSIQYLLRECDLSVLVTAMSAMPEPALNRIYDNVSTKASTVIKQELQDLAQVEPNLLTKSQQVLQHKIDALHLAGKIELISPSNS